MLTFKENSGTIALVHEKLWEYFEVLFLSSVICSQILNSWSGVGQLE
jgi:hypothetical protein